MKPFGFPKCPATPWTWCIWCYSNICGFLRYIPGHWYSIPVLCKQIPPVVKVMGDSLDCKYPLKSICDCRKYFGHWMEANGNILSMKTSPLHWTPSSRQSWEWIDSYHSTSFLDVYFTSIAPLPNDRIRDDRWSIDAYDRDDNAGLIPSLALKFLGKTNP